MNYRDELLRSRLVVGDDFFVGLESPGKLSIVSMMLNEAFEGDTLRQSLSDQMLSIASFPSKLLREEFRKISHELIPGLLR